MNQFTNANPLVSWVVGRLGGVVGGQLDGRGDVDVVIDRYGRLFVRKYWHKLDENGRDGSGTISV